MPRFMVLLRLCTLLAIFSTASINFLELTVAFQPLQYILTRNTMYVGWRLFYYNLHIIFSSPYRELYWIETVEKGIISLCDQMRFTIPCSDSCHWYKPFVYSNLHLSTLLCQVCHQALALFKSTYYNTMKSLKDDRSIIKVVHKLMVSGVGRRNFLAQVTCLLLFQLTLVRSSYDH